MCQSISYLVQELLSRDTSLSQCKIGKVISWRYWEVRRRLQGRFMESWHHLQLWPHIALPQDCFIPLNHLPMGKTKHQPIKQRLIVIWHWLQKECNHPYFNSYWSRQFKSKIPREKAHVCQSTSYPWMTLRASIWGQRCIHPTWLTTEVSNWSTA